MTIPSETARRLSGLFAGHDAWHGTHGVPEWDAEKSKWKIKSTACTLPGAATEHLWRAHLDGRHPLGVMPIRRDSTCSWGSIDVDDYALDVVTVVGRVRKAGYPLVPCRSKSGGLHLFLFLREPEPAAAVRKCLAAIASALDYPDAEIFPKQDQLAEDDKGSWILVPYFGGDFDGKLCMQRGVKTSGSDMTVEEFAAAAEAAKTGTGMIKIAKARRKRSPRSEAHAEQTYASTKLHEWAAAVREAPDGTANTELNRACFVMGTTVAREWIAREDVEAELGAAARQRGFPETEISEMLRRCIDAGMQEPHADLDARPVIRVKPGELDATATHAEEALLAAKVPLFQRGGLLVRPVVEEVDAAHGRRTKIAQFVRVEQAYLRTLLNRVARFAKYDGRSGRWAPIDPPTETAITILSRIGEWSFPAVAGVITTPTMRPDGSLLTEPGYDAATRLLLVEPPPMPAIPDEPTRAQALSALELLDGLLTEFPFENEVARALALSMLITPVARGAFMVTPMPATTAPVPGSGKSFLHDVVAAIAIGQPMPVMTAGRTEEETEKRLGAALLAGQPLISIDNLNGELHSDMLCQLIERPLVEVRILGRSERVRIETRSATFFANGNNLVIAGDLCRRTLPCRLDPKLERPELRAFSGDPVAAVLADRGKYIAAALIICRAYHVAGRPGKAKRLASFQAWSDTVRSALIWLGKADPVEAMEAARENDPVIRSLRAMLLTCSAVMGLGHKYRFRMQDVIDAVDEHDDDGAPAWPDLSAAVQGTVRGGRSADASGLGRWAQRFKGRIVDDLSFDIEPNPKGGSL
jgi:hypothetical protein